jgi:hypothetical protein
MNLAQRPFIGQFLVALLLVIGVSMLLLVFQSVSLPH